MVIFKSYFSGEHIVLSFKKRCEHRIRKTNKLATQSHELGLPCVISELQFAKFTLCIFRKLIDI